MRLQFQGILVEGKCKWLAGRAFVLSVLSLESGYIKDLAKVLQFMGIFTFRTSDSCSIDHLACMAMLEKWVVRIVSARTCSRICIQRC